MNWLRVRELVRKYRKGAPDARFVPAFEETAYVLAPGQLSEPVLTQFGYHVIRVDARQGDTLALRHILVPVGQSDSSAARTDDRASAHQGSWSSMTSKAWPAASPSLGLPAGSITERAKAKLT